MTHYVTVCTGLNANCAAQSANEVYMLSFAAGLVIGILLFIIVQTYAMVDTTDDCIIFYVGIGWVTIAKEDTGYNYGFSFDDPTK